MKPERPARSSPRIAACSVQFTVSGEPAGMGYCPLEITIRTCIRGLHRQQESEREPTSYSFVQQAMCVIGSTQSLPSTIALASLVLLRKRKNLTGRPPAAAPDHYGGGDGAEPTGVPVFNPFQPAVDSEAASNGEHQFFRGTLPAFRWCHAKQSASCQRTRRRLEWLAGRPQAARCAFMRLISPGFRSLRAILRS